MASALPDELWRKILETGLERSNLCYKDLCCVAISCRSLYRLSNEDTLWSNLLSRDFHPAPVHNTNIDNGCFRASNAGSSKLLYKIRYERDRIRKLAAHRRAVLRLESRSAELSRMLQSLHARKLEEEDKLHATRAELSNLLKIRQASVALNVWQPEVVRGRQKQIVEQCAVPIDARIHALENELKLCSQQIIMLGRAYGKEKQKFETTKDSLVSMKYHPLRDYSATASEVGGSSGKRKVLKRSINADKEECEASGAKKIHQ